MAVPSGLEAVRARPPAGLGLRESGLQEVFNGFFRRAIAAAALEHSQGERATSRPPAAAPPISAAAPSPSRRRWARGGATHSAPRPSAPRRRSQSRRPGAREKMRLEGRVPVLRWPAAGLFSAALFNTAIRLRLGPQVRDETATPCRFCGKHPVDDYGHKSVIRMLSGMRSRARNRVRDALADLHRQALVTPTPEPHTFPSSPNLSFYFSGIRNIACCAHSPIGAPRSASC